MRFKEWLLSEGFTTNPAQLWRQLWWPPNTMEDNMPLPPNAIAPIWNVKYMTVKPDTVQKTIGNQTGSIQMGNLAAKYVDTYSAYPPRVYERVLRKLSQQVNEINPEQQQQMYTVAKKAAEAAAPVHQRLMAKNYGYKPTVKSLNSKI